MKAKEIKTYFLAILLLFALVACKKNQEPALEEDKTFDISGHWVTVKDIRNHTGNVIYLDFGTVGTGMKRIDKVDPQGGIVVYESALLWSVQDGSLTLELDEPKKHTEVYTFEFADKGNELLLKDKDGTVQRYYREIYD